MEYEDRLTITTPEGVSVDLVLAGIGSRFMAALLDVVIQAAIGFVVAIVLVLLLDGGVLVLFISVGAFLLLFAYDVSFEVLNNGRTPGKRAAGLRVVRDTGARVTFVASAIRNMLRLVDFLPGLYGVAIVSVFVTRRHQRLGDIAAGTIVVRERKPAATPVAGPPPAGERLYGWDTSAITPEDLAVVRSFLDRRSELNPGARTHLAKELADRLRAKTAGAPDLPAETFLESLAATRD